MRNVFLIAGFILCATISFCCHKEDPGDPGPNEIWLEYQLFRPSQLEVATGTTVHFINKGNPNHTVQGTLFSTGTLQTDDEYSYTFTTPGVFYFNCGIHGNITSEQVAIHVQ